jgi:predicted PurR-regulated permease PerM
MHLHPHVRTAGNALKHWLIAQTQDALVVGAAWYIGLLIIRVPLAGAWAVVGGLCQFVPNIGPVIAVIGPTITCALIWDWNRFLYVLILYVIIIVTDGLLLQPYLMKRAARVPIWASIVLPIVLGVIIPFWGVLLAPPLLAVIYAFKSQKRTLSPPADPEVR